MRVAALHYQQDAAGNRTQVAETLAQVGGSPITPTTTYSYDRLYRLTGDGTNSYTYDPVGNRLTWGSTSSSYDRADRITAAGATSYTLNANGNTTARGSDSFAYDQANRLTSATVGGTTTTYAFDGDGKRASSTTGGTTTSYVSDVGGGLPLLLSDGTRTYVHRPGGLAYSVDGSANVLVSHADGLGSQRALTDGSGTLTQTYRTDPFGVVTATQGSSTQPFGFTGEQTDSTGLVYLRARMYDPQSGRFLQRDTVAKSGPGVSGWNRYSYVGNNPVNATDPSGNCPYGVCQLGQVLSGPAGQRAVQIVVAAGALAAASVATASDQLLDSLTAVALDVSAWRENQIEGVAVKNWPADLPRTGKHPYIPPKANHGRAERNHQGQYVDENGNLWDRDRSKPWPEWDVQHPQTGTHTNVGPNGEVTHGEDNFPNQ